jgi:hypothetical protein
MKELIIGILLIFGLIFMLSIMDGTEIAHAVSILNISNGNSTMNNNSAILNSTSGNSTAPYTIDSIPGDDKSGSIASLPGKCLGSALCPD